MATPILMRANLPTRILRSDRITRSQGHDLPNAEVKKHRGELVEKSGLDGSFKSGRKLRSIHGPLKCACRITEYRTKRHNCRGDTRTPQVDSPQASNASSTGKFQRDQNGQCMEDSQNC